MNNKYLPALIERKKALPLTDVVCALKKIADDHNDAMNWASEELAAFHAPSECGGLVYPPMERELIYKVHTTCKQYGWSPEVLRGVLHKRVSGKWLYYSGVESVLHDACAAREEEQHRPHYRM